VLVAAQYWQPVLQGECRDPSVVRRDRTARPSESHPQRGVGDSGRLRDGEDVEARQLGLEPRLVSPAMPGLGDAIAEFAQHNDRDRRTRLPPQNLSDGGISVHERGERAADGTIVAPITKSAAI
jgi:hypothetical protein